jgi:hypothetical protein
VEKHIRFSAPCLSRRQACWREADGLGSVRYALRQVGKCLKLAPLSPSDSRRIVAQRPLDQGISRDAASAFMGSGLRRCRIQCAENWLPRSPVQPFAAPNSHPKSSKIDCGTGVENTANSVDSLDRVESKTP